MSLRVASLHVHPVKSCRGVAVAAARVSRHGLDGDRAFAFLDDAGRVLTQRQHPRMAQVEASVDGGTLTLAATGRTQIRIDTRDPAVLPTTAAVHSATVAALRYRDDSASRWMSEHLGTPATFVRRDPHDKTFTDGLPISVFARASMDALNAQLESPLPIDHFRANLILDGAPALAEDTIERFEIGGVTFAVVKRIERCVMIQTHQRTGERGVEPMRTLRDLRAVMGRVYFGRYFTPSGEGELKVEDGVRVLESR